MMDEEILKKNVEALTELISSGKTIEAMELFYSDNVTMQENEEKPRIGKNECINHEKKNLRRTKNFNGQLLNQAIDSAKQVVFSEWEYNFTIEGKNFRLIEVSVQNWNNHQIVAERFYYKNIAQV